MDNRKTAPEELQLLAIIDSEINVPAGAALERLKVPLQKALTFENAAWKRKRERGLYVGDEPRYRLAYRAMEDGSLRLSRGSWRTLAELARQHNIQLQWDARIIKAEDRPTDFSLEASLRPYQSAAIEAAIASRGGVIVIPTGGGKTMIAFGLAAALQTQTLFIVHTRELLQQTCEAAARILETEPGILGGGQWKPRPFTVALIQTLARRDLSELCDQFGLLIVDEAHHAPAHTYCQVLPMFPARYRVALTATPFRKDGMHELLWLQFGEIVYRLEKRDLEEHGRLLSPSIHPIPTEFFYEFDDDFVHMISALCNNHRRHKLLLETIQTTHRTGGCSLILTERVDHAENLYQGLFERGLPVVLLHGRLNSKQREESLDKLRTQTAELLVATLSLIGEGWDHPPLDTLYLTVPNGNRTKTTQALGRILRPHPNKPNPRVFDFVDLNIGVLRHHWSVRARVYGLAPDAIRASLQLPPLPPPPPYQPEKPNVSPERWRELIRAAAEGNFDMAHEDSENTKEGNSSIEEST